MICRFSLLWMLVLSALADFPVSGASEPPAMRREFRGVWIASVGNIDWPSKPGLPVAQQQAELRGLLDDARKLNLNVVILQVRPGCDALYASRFEPWSEYLSGRMGQAPSPKWDPLQFACDEAHARGLELHAWVNPFRARYHEARSPISADHVSRTHPGWVVNYGSYLWLDPGLPEARAWSLRVITDIVRRYDVDGLHIDDYFYPYPEKDGAVLMPFPDDASYARYRREGGRLERDDWRRGNVDGFIETLDAAVHAEKPWVKFGISPFGIWRPGSPAGIKGLDAYGLLYADARRWLREGWCDYVSPQLYWALGKREQSFPGLLRWWAEQNSKGRILAPGVASASVGKDRPALDIVNQLGLTRTDGGAHGIVFWNATSLRKDLGGVASGLAREMFAQPALVPATPWLGNTPPPMPGLRALLKAKNSLLSLTWKERVKGSARSFVLQVRTGGQWQQEIVAGGTGYREFDGRRGGRVPDEVRVVPIGRTGLAGESARWLKPGPK